MADTTDTIKEDVIAYEYILMVEFVDTPTRARTKDRYNGHNGHYKKERYSELTRRRLHGT